MQDKLKYKLESWSENCWNYAMLLLTVLVLVWSYVVFSIFNDNWNWVIEAFRDLENAKEFMVLISVFLISIGFAAAIGALVFWNIKVWMFPMLLQCLLCLFGWLPFVRRFDSNVLREKDLRQESREDIAIQNKINRWMPEEYVIEDRNAFGRKRKTYVTDYHQESLDSNWLLDTIWFIIRRILLAVLYFIGAIGIPVGSPLLILLGLAAVSAIVKENSWILLILGILMFAAVLLAYIILPARQKKK